MSLCTLITKSTYLFASHRTRKRLNLESVLLVLTICSLFFHSFLTVSIDGLAFKLYRMVPIVASFLLLFIAWKKKREIPLSALVISCTFMVMIVMTLLASFFFPLNLETLFKLFSIVLLVIAFSVTELTSKEYEHAFRIAALIILCVVFVNCFIHIEQIYRYAVLHIGDHPAFQTLISGGVNIEATWLSLFVIFFRRSPLGFFYILSSLCISLLYGSRAGLMALALAVFYVLLLRDTDKPVKRLIYFFPWLVIGVIAFLLFCGILGMPVLDRFLNIGSEPGSLGRMAMWQYVPQVFEDTPFIGTGLGASMPYISLLSDVPFTEDNMHNIYLQFLIEFGPIGLLLLAVFISFPLGFLGKSNGQNSAAFFVLAFLLLGFVQFGGIEPYAAVVLGLMLQKEKRTSTGMQRFNHFVKQQAHKYTFSL